MALDVFLKVLEQSVPPHPREQVALRRLLQWLKGGKEKEEGKKSCYISTSEEKKENGHSHNKSGA